MLDGRENVGGRITHTFTRPLDLVDPARTWERLAAKLTTTDPDECWEWTGATDRGSGGYGVFAVKCHTGGRYGWRASKPHRVAWTILRGPIPDGLVIDHVECANRVCCNPSHMAVVTQAMNAEHSQVPRSAACQRCGGTDWIILGRRRRCRPCWNDYHREWQRAQRAVKPEQPCAWCGTMFQPGKRRTYCSPECASHKTTLAYRRAHAAAPSGTAMRC